MDEAGNVAQDLLQLDLFLVGYENWYLSGMGGDRYSKLKNRMPSTPLLYRSIDSGAYQVTCWVDGLVPAVPLSIRNPAYQDSVQEYGIKLYRSPETGYGACIPPSVWVGVFPELELQEMALWHEIGHVIEKAHRGPHPLSPYFNEIECRAWRYGIEEATRKGATFSTSAYAWAETALKSYFEEAVFPGCSIYWDEMKDYAFHK